MKINSYEGILSLIGDLGIQADLNVLSGSLRVDGVTDGLLRTLASLHHMVAENRVGVDTTPSTYISSILLPLTREIALMRDALEYSRGVREFYTTSCVSHINGSSSNPVGTAVGYGRVIWMKQSPIMVETFHDPTLTYTHESNLYSVTVPGTVIFPRNYTRGLEALPRTFIVGSESQGSFLGSYAFVDSENRLVRVSATAQRIRVDTFYSSGVYTVADAELRFGTGIEFFSNRQLESKVGILPCFNEYQLHGTALLTYDPNSFQILDNGSVSGDSWDGVVPMFKHPRELGVIDTPYSKMTLLMAMINRLRVMISAD